MVNQTHFKEILKQELLQVLQRELENLERAYAATKAGATHEEAKPEHAKDTRALEQTYLARGQAKRVEEMRKGVVSVERMTIRAFPEDTPIAVGALVRVIQDDEEKRLFVAPEGGGTALSSGTVQVVTPRSPVGRALVGKHQDDQIELIVAGQMRVLEIVDVT